MTHREIRSDEPSATSLLQIHHAEEDDDDDLHCPQCLISFRSAKTKETHFKRNHPEQYTRHLMQNDTLFSCYKCDKLFASPEELRVHNGLHYQVDDIPVCSSCSQVFANFNGLYKHKRKGCVQDVWHCRDCNVDCPKLLDFHFHCIEAHDQDVVSAAQSSGRLCSICECHFLTDEALQSHQDRVKSGKMKPTTKRQLRAKTKKVSGKKKKKMEEEDEEEEDEEEEEIEEEELKIPCSKRDCDLVFPSIDALRAHKRKMH